MSHVTPNFKAAKPIKDATYRNYVKQLPCAICTAFGYPYGQPPSDFHHAICFRYSQAKECDSTGIPLCKAHHQTGADGKTAVHLNKALFIEKYSPDRDYIATTMDAVETQFGYRMKGF